MKFNMYDRVRIRKAITDLPNTVKPGDIGLVDGVIYSTIGWYHVSFDPGTNHGVTMREDELERITS